MSVLHTASEYGNIEVMKLLLSHGAKTDIVTEVIYYLYFYSIYVLLLCYYLL